MFLKMKGICKEKTQNTNPFLSTNNKNQKKKTTFNRCMRT